MEIFRKPKCFKAFCVSAWEEKADKRTKVEALTGLDQTIVCSNCLGEPFSFLTPFRIAVLPPGVCKAGSNRQGELRKPKGGVFAGLCVLKSRGCFLRHEHFPSSGLRVTAPHCRKQKRLPGGAPASVLTPFPESCRDCRRIYTKRQKDTAQHLSHLMVL